MTRIAVVVTCHAPYLKWLKSCLDSIDSQNYPAAEKVLVLDGCEAPPWLAHTHWQVHIGSWAHPNPARNVGLRETTSPWIVFFDADNRMAPGYLDWMQAELSMCDLRVGIVYPNIRFCDSELVSKGFWRMPQYDYWSLRSSGNYIDTASAWRRHAVEQVGGWCGTSSFMDDYDLALRITDKGWSARHANGSTIMMREHPDRRSHAITKSEAIMFDTWDSRSMGVVTLFAGRIELLQRWRDSLFMLKVPPRCGLYVLDNSGNDDFGDELLIACDSIRDKFTHVDMGKCGSPYVGVSGEPYLVLDRHRRVAKLYSDVIPRVQEDLIVTFEDDMEPLSPNALFDLASLLSLQNKVGAACATYRCASNRDYVCGATNMEIWNDVPVYDSVPPEPVEMGFIGGGFTVWGHWALMDSPIYAAHHSGSLYGWDGNLSRAIRERGYKLMMHGGVKCLHHTHGKVAVD